MKKTSFTETQIIKVIQEHEGGRDAKDICRDLFAQGDIKSFELKKN